MALFERVDADGTVRERAFLPSARPDRDDRVRAAAAAGLNGWRKATGKPPVERTPDGPPAKSAAKAAWVAWAVIQGMDAEEADAATKDDLVRDFGPDAQRGGEDDDPGNGPGDDPDGGGE